MPTAYELLAASLLGSVGLLFSGKVYMLASEVSLTRNLGQSPKPCALSPIGGNFRTGVKFPGSKVTWPEVKCISMYMHNAHCRLRVGQHLRLQLFC